MLIFYILDLFLKFKRKPCNAGATVHHGCYTQEPGNSSHHCKNFCCLLASATPPHYHRSHLTL